MAAQLPGGLRPGEAGNLMGLPELAPSARFPIEIVLAYEDGAFEKALLSIDAAIHTTPQSVALRALHQAILSARDPDAFLSREMPLAGPDAARADRYEAAHHQVLRLLLERQFYRGDRGEGARDFIARLERRAAEVDAELAALAQGTQAMPWAPLSRAMLHRFLNRLEAAEKQALWTLLGDAGPWRRYLRMIAIEQELVPVDDGRSWLERDLVEAERQNDPLAARMRLVLLELQSRTMRREDSIALYAAAEATFPAGVWRDDFDLAYARQLSNSYAIEDRKRGVARLTPLVHPPKRNTTTPAMQELGSLLRRLALFPTAVEHYEQYHQRYPSERFRFDRELGRAFYQMRRYPDAVAAFRRSVQSPRGNGEDYLRIAETMRFLPEATASPVAAVQVRGEALKLSDFASAAMSEEVRVRSWAMGRPAQLGEMLSRLSELKVLSRHAMLYPLTFLTVGLQGLVELLAVGLGLIVFVSYPRLSRRVWRVTALVAGAALVLPAVALLTPLPTPFSRIGSLAWLGQAGVRLFFIMAGAVVLSPVVGMSGLQFFRAARRSWRRGRLPKWFGSIWPVLLCAFVLTAVGIISARLGRAPTLYLQRLPTLLTGAELGAVEAEVGALARFSLLLYHVLRTELLARGFLLALLALLLKRWQYGRAVAVVTGALLWTLLTAGAMEPASSQLLVGFSGSLLLGWLRLRHGFDGALVAHAAACVVTGGAV